MLASAVCHKNVGNTYLSPVNKKVGLPQINIPQPNAVAFDRKVVQRREREKQSEVRVKGYYWSRPVLLREGPSYQTSTALHQLSEVEVASS